MVVNEMLQQIDFDPQLIEQVVFGQVIQMPEAPNIAREIVLGTGMNIGTDAYSVTRACATSFQAAANVTESIISGTIDIGIAGGGRFLLGIAYRSIKEDGDHVTGIEQGQNNEQAFKTA